MCPTAFVSLQTNCLSESAAVTFFTEKFNIELQHLQLATTEVMTAHRSMTNCGI